MEWHEVDEKTRRQDQFLAHMDRRYKEHGLAPARVFEGRCETHWIVAILSRDPSGPQGEMETHLSITTTLNRIPNNKPFGCPSFADFHQVAAELCPGKEFEIYTKCTSLSVVHGFAKD